jgi:hypothetical protein
VSPYSCTVLQNLQHLFDATHTLSCHLITILKNSFFACLMTLYEQDYVAPSKQRGVKNVAVLSKP